MRKCFGMMELFYNLIRVESKHILYICIYTYMCMHITCILHVCAHVYACIRVCVKTHQNRCIECIILLYVNYISKEWLKKKKKLHKQLNV